MKSLDCIQEESDEAAVQAAEKNKEPYVFWDDADVDSNSARAIPNIGSYVPEGWEEYGDALFVDSSGFGGDREPALSIDQYTAKVKELIAEADDIPGPVTLGFAIVEVGQFQVYIQPFKKDLSYRKNKK